MLEHFILITLITIFITIYISRTIPYNKYDYWILQGALLGQILFLVGIETDKIILRETAHMIFVGITLLGSFMSQHYMVRLFIFLSNISVWISHYVLNKCVFRLFDKTQHPIWKFPPEWISINIGMFWIVITTISLYRLIR